MNSADQPKPGTQEEQWHSLPSTLYDESYFLTACEGYEEYATTEGRQLSRRLEQAFSVAGITPGMRVLDVGSGRGEIVLHCARLSAQAYGIDYAAVANQLAMRMVDQGSPRPGTAGIVQADAKTIPFPSRSFDRVLMFDIVEHLYPWELQETYRQVHRVLRDDGLVIIHTAPNRWYDRYAYPLVRLYRRLTGRGAAYPRNPREIIPMNLHVHVNEQDLLSLRRGLRRAGFRAKVWLDTPPQQLEENPLLTQLRRVAFGWPPFRWFFEREVFAVAWKQPTGHAR
jgi:ubiquinone/menaquinone biosynthesis C-methylase UbiE